MLRIRPVLRASIYLFAGLWVAACGPGVEGGDVTESAVDPAPLITLTGAWVRPNLLPGRPAAAYFTVNNHGDQPDSLIGIGVPTGGRAHLHRSKRNGDIMQMLMITSVTIPPGGTLEFGPGGFHAMLSDLSVPPKAGEVLLLELYFERAGTLLVGAKVRPIGESN